MDFPAQSDVRRRQMLFWLPQQIRVLSIWVLFFPVWNSLFLCLRALFTLKYRISGFPLPLALIMNPISGYYWMRKICSFVFPAGKPPNLDEPAILGPAFAAANSSGTMSPNVRGLKPDTPALDSSFCIIFGNNENKNRTQRL